MENAEIKAIDILLQERMPRDMLITKEKKEKTKKIKYTGYDNYVETTITKIDETLRKCNVISNEKYMICINDKGEGFSKYKDILVNKYKETKDIQQGIFFYIKNVRTNKMWKSNFDYKDAKTSKYEVLFAEDKAKFIKTVDDIETENTIITAENLGVEIRSIKIKNNSDREEELEVTSIFEPVLSKKEDDIAHPAFNNLFLKYSLTENGDILIKRNKRGNTKEIYLGCNLFIENNEIQELEYEIDLSKVYKMLEEGKPFSKQIGLVTDPVVALKRKIKLKSNEEITLNLIISVSEEKEEVLENLNYYRLQENVKREFNISKAKAEEEARYLSLSRNDLITFNSILPYIMYQNPMKAMYLQDLPKKEYKQSDFWKYGISGDIPIILVKIKAVNDIYVIKEILKAHEYLRAKGIKTDLVILDYEKDIYEQYVKDQIIQEILNMQIGYLQNISGGIFLLNANEIEDEDLFTLRANLILQANKGSVYDAVKEMEEDYKKQIKNIGNEKSSKINSQELEKTISKEKQELQCSKFETIKPNIDFSKLKYYNEYGGFSEDGREYIIKLNKKDNIPAPWSNVLANENFGTIVTSNMGGYTWKKNSRLNRITSWANTPTNDIPSEIIYLKDIDYAKTWSLNLSPMPDEEDYYVYYGFGYAKYYHASLGIIQETEIFVPNKDSIKINIVRLKNTTSEKRKLKLVYYIKPVLGEDETKTDGYIDLKFEENILYAKNIYGEGLSKLVYVSSSEKIISYTGNNLSFVGNGDLSNPEELEKVELSKENSLGTKSCIALELEIELEAYEDKKLILMLGEEDEKEIIKEQVEKYKDIEKAEEELKLEKEYWNKTLRRLQIKTEEEAMDIILNGWAMYQTMVCRLFARTGYYQSGGAFGFRDQLQDALSTKFISRDILKNQILKHARHQFEEGDVEHWWHDDTKRGIRTRFSDDFLWLVYAVCEYIEFTGDFGILDEKVPYIKGNLLEASEDEKYDIYEESEKVESIYDHCIKAIEKSLNFGENLLPKIGSGDWNDGFSTVGNKGIGESVWLGFFLYNILDRFDKICEKIGKVDYIQKYEKIKNSLKQAVNEAGWDGNWYKRAFMDTKEILGSSKNEECKIDSIAQSWSVISSAGDEDKKRLAMENLEKYLVNYEVGIIKLLDPPFENSSLEPGYIKAYLPGVRENGGQYTHAAIWAVIAMAVLKINDKAEKLYEIINPIEHTRTKEEVLKYKVEPYTIVADIYGHANLLGRGRLDMVYGI